MQVYFLFTWKLQANKVHQKYLLYTSQGSQISKISKVCSRVCFVKDLRISSQKQKSLNRTGKKEKKVEQKATLPSQKSFFYDTFAAFYHAVWVRGEENVSYKALQ